MTTLITAYANLTRRPAPSVDSPQQVCPYPDVPCFKAGEPLHPVMSPPSEPSLLEIGGEFAGELIAGLYPPTALGQLGQELENSWNKGDLTKDGLMMAGVTALGVVASQKAHAIAGAGEKLAKWAGFAGKEEKALARAQQMGAHEAARQPDFGSVEGASPRKPSFEVVAPEIQHPAANRVGETDFNPANPSRLSSVSTIENVFSVSEIAAIRSLREKMQAIPNVKLTNVEIKERAADYYASQMARQAAGGVIKQEKKLDIVLGHSGSGKSSNIVDPLAKEKGALVIDSDFIKPTVPGFENGLGSTATHQASTKIALATRDLAFKNGDNIIFPSSGSSLEGLKIWIKDAKKHGYSVHVTLADLPAEKAARRVYSRNGELVPRPDGSSYRQMIDPELTLIAGNKPIDNFNNLVQEGLVDSHVHLNADVPKGAPFKIIRKSP